MKDPDLSGAMVNFGEDLDLGSVDRGANPTGWIRLRRDPRILERIGGQSRASYRRESVEPVVSMFIGGACEDDPSFVSFAIIVLRISGHV
ncbi:hypothetical protein [Microbacterium faecale]|uniref:hypothetical protein n=1 Tax=Microbacterium faecale TaxID=1804630 RepID=UPI0016693498|nr:hypothetical protein [Microbacterium faecale]